MAIGTTSLGALHASAGSRGGKQFIVLGSLWLPVATESATCARRFARMVLDLSGGTADVRDDVELIVSELVTNVVLHVERDGEPFALVVFAQLRATLRLEVTDSGESMSQTAEPDSTGEHGRGRVVAEPDHPRSGSKDAEPSYRVIAAALRAKIENGELVPERYC
jgi:hypothetical protein